jgi:serine O-acetyltransferase
VEGTTVDVNLVLTTNICPMAEYLKDQVNRKVLSVSGIEKVNVNILDEPWNWDRFKEQTQERQSAKNGRSAETGLKISKIL